MMFSANNRCSLSCASLKKAAVRPCRAALLPDAGRAIRGLLVLLVLFAGQSMSGQVQAYTDLVEEGRYVVAAAGCVSCHRNDQTLAGGPPIVTPYGTYFPSNITPHREQGIGRWSEEDFVRALRMGISPGGQHYYPAFPYPSYTRMTRRDMQALYAYLMTKPESARQSPPHIIPWPLSSRALINHWKHGRFTPGVAIADPTRTPQWNRGAYLATALGHCGECHTPRGFLGTPRSDRYLAGTCSGPEGLRVPNITPDEETGIGRWTTAELDTFLATGRRPDGCYASGLMMEVLGTSCMQLTDYDRQALAFYLASLPPIHNNLDSLCASFEDDEFLE